MLVDSLLPGTVLALKLLFKLTMEQQFSRLEFMKALLNFPVDIAFLSFSFGAAVLLKSQGQGVTPSLVGVIAFPIICTTLAGVVVVLCRKSDRAFVAERNLLAILFATIGYAVSLAVTFFALHAGVVIP